MAEKITYRFLPEDKCLTERQLFDYIDGKLNAADMYAVEKHLLDCEMCSDALEGFEKIQHREKVAAFSPAGLENAKEKNDSETTPTKVIPLHPNRKYYAIAAGLILILGVSLYFKTVSGEMEKSKTAALEQKDSTASVIISPKENSPEKFKTDCLTRSEVSGKDEKNVSRELNDGDQQKPAYWNKFGFTDTMKQANEENAPVVNLKSEDQSTAHNNVSPVPDATLERSALDESKNLNQVQLQDQQEKELAKTEQKKSETKSVNDADDAVESDAKTKAPAQKDNYRFQDNNRDKVAAKEDNKATAAHETNVPAAQPSTPTSQGTAAPANANAGAMSTGSSSTINTATDYKTNVAINTDSTVADTPRLYPRPLVASDKDLDLSYENGVKMLDSGQTTASLVFFDEVLKNPNHHYYQDAQWKKALALIQLNRKPEAKTLLQEIVKKGGRYKSQADAELKKL